jgi:hypothetical protein
MDVSSINKFIHHFTEPKQADMGLLELSLDNTIKPCLQLQGVLQNLLAVVVMDVEVLIGTVLGYGKNLICKLVDAAEISEELRLSIDAEGGGHPDGSDGVAEAILHRDGLRQVAHGEREFLDKLA